MNKKQITRTNEFGHTLLEVVCALLVAAPLLAAGIAGMQHISALAVKHSLAADELFNQYKLRGLLRRVMSDTDSHRFNILPRLHSHGVISYSDGGAHPLNDSHGKYRLDPKSSAISGLELELMHTLSIVERGHNSLNVLACSRFGTRIRSSYDDFIGISFKDFAQYAVVARTTELGNCERLQLQPLRGMHVQNGIIDPRTLQLLLPITRSYTLYRSESGQLRYVTYRGDTIVENALAAPRVEPFTLGLLEGAQSGLSTLQVSYGRHRTYFFPSLLQREPLEAFLLQGSL